MLIKYHLPLRTQRVHALAIKWRYRNTCLQGTLKLRFQRPSFWHFIASEHLDFATLTPLRNKVHKMRLTTGLPPGCHNHYPFFLGTYRLQACPGHTNTLRYLSRFAQTHDKQIKSPSQTTRRVKSKPADVLQAKSLNRNFTDTQASEAVMMQRLERQPLISC